MKNTIKTSIVSVAFVLLYITFVDKTFFHMAGLKTVEKVAFVHTFIPKSGQTVKNEEAKMRQAGYQWAEDNAILDKNKCQNENPEFVSGCKTYVYDNGEDTLQDQDSALDK